MKKRNPRADPQRRTESLTLRTQQLVETFHGKFALLSTWEAESDAVQDHAYILKLRAKVRTLRNRIAHRAYEVEI